MEAAAALPWKHLERPLRQQLAAAPRGSKPLQIHLGWSGDARGNAASVDHASPSSPLARSSAAHFVIGNGSRSGDGEIDSLSSGLSLKEERIEITLIGRGGSPTPDQLAALGELLHHLEALTGQVLLPGTPVPLPSNPV